MPTNEAAIVAEARRVARIQARMRTLRRELRTCSGELRVAKKNLRALASSTRDPFEQAPPLRMFGETAGGK
jgi:ribosomal protein L10